MFDMWLKIVKKACKVVQTRAFGGTEAMDKNYN